MHIPWHAPPAGTLVLRGGCGWQAGLGCHCRPPRMLGRQTRPGLAAAAGCSAPAGKRTMPRQPGRRAQEGSNGRKL
eukprot:1138791-Pelagomonas_calceolata.AAC.6